MIRLKELGRLLKLATGRGVVQLVPVDPCYGDRELHAWHDRVAAGDWKAIEAFLGSQADPVRRDFGIAVLQAQVVGRPDWLDAWVTARPDQALPRIFRGAHGIAWAWQARGVGRAHTVNDAAVRTFFERLFEARVDLEAATGLAPDDPAPWAFQMPLARGLGYELWERQRIVDKVVERRPWDEYMATQQIQSLAPKWGGSIEAMFGFARDALERAPEGHGVRAIIADAHYEAWVEGNGRDNYWRSPEVGEEIRRAAATSVDAPNAIASPWTVRHRNVLADCYQRLGDTDALRRELEQIGDVVTFPWTLGVDPQAGRLRLLAKYGITPRPAAGSPTV